MAHGLLDGELLASPANQILSRTGLDELEAIAKGIVLPHHGVNLYISSGQGEFQAYDFADGNLDAQYRGNARFADVHAMSAHHFGIARVDTNFDFQLVAGMAAQFHCLSSVMGCELAAKIHGLH